jgi:hypothetical protein
MAVHWSGPLESTDEREPVGRVSRVVAEHVHCAALALSQRQRCSSSAQEYFFFLFLLLASDRHARIISAALFDL